MELYGKSEKSYVQIFGITNIAVARKLPHFFQVNG